MRAPAPSQYMVSSLLLMLVGWGGLGLLIFYFNLPPLVWARWGFFALWFVALTGTALPFAYLLNLRFPADPPAPPRAIVRQSQWVGIYGSLLAWLQLGRLITLWVWMGLAGGLVAVEYLIRLRERAHWQPPDLGNDLDEGGELGWPGSDESTQ
jgi:hypothetical protein